MRWVLAMALIAASSFFLYREYLEQKALPPPAPKAAEPVKKEPFLPAADIEKVRKTASDPDPGVRWTSMRLLFMLGDAGSLERLQDAVAKDPDVDLRLKAVKLLQDNKGLASMQGLVAALRDPDKDVRLASVKALAEVGEAAAAPSVSAVAAKDNEPDVRVEALRTLEALQDKRLQQFYALAEKLRKDYEEAVEKAKRKHEEETHSGG